MTRGSSTVRLWGTLAWLGASAFLLSVLLQHRLATAYDPQRAAALRCAQAYRLEPGVYPPFRLRPGEVYSYRIALSQGQVLSAVVDQMGIDAVVSLLAPSGKLLLEVDSLNQEQGPEPVFAVAETAGNYCLEVSASSEDPRPGRYRVRILPPRPPRATDRLRAAGALAFSRGEQLRRTNQVATLRAAIGEYEMALGFWSSLGDLEQKAQTLFSLAKVYKLLSDPARALSLFGEARPLWAGRPEEALLENRIGLVESDLGHSEAALAAYRRAQEIARHFGDRPRLAAALNNMGLLYRSRGELRQALDFFNSSLELHALTGLSDQATLLGNLGDLYLALGRPADALEASGQGIAIQQHREDRIGEARLLRTQGIAQLKLGHSAEALDSLKRSLDLSRQGADRTAELSSLNALGAFYLETRRPREGLSILAEALRLARELGDQSGEANALANLGGIYDLTGEGRRAIQYFAQALSIYEQLKDPGAQASVLYGRARAERRLGRLDEARPTIEKAIAIVESLRAQPGSSELRATFLASRHDYYELAVDLLMQLDEQRPGEGYAARAFEASERTRARTLLEDLNRGGDEVHAGVDGELLARRATLEQQLTSLEQVRMRLAANTEDAAGQSLVAIEAQIRSLSAKLEDAKSAIRKGNPHYAALAEPQPLSLRELQEKVLDDGTALLEYALGEERSFLWLVRRDALLSWVLPPGREIEAAAVEAYNQLSNRPNRETQGRTNRSLARLSRLLLPAAAGELKEERLVVVADGALQYIPFGVLLNSDTAAGASKGGPRSLITHHEIVSLPSASLPAFLRQEMVGRAVPPKAVALLADPVFERGDERVQQAGNGPFLHSESGALADAVRSARDVGLGSLDRLSSSRTEAQSIASLVPPGQSLLALDFAANRQLVTASILAQYRILHIATHALLDERHPELSGIVLSLFDREGRPQEGFLRTYEVYNLNLPIDLVVLSACRTALGEDVRGEGLVGLTRGFMYAGAPRVVVSLWNVSDKATARLMTLFYQGMLERGLKPAAALRAAQVEMSATPGPWQAPYFWAGFVLQGEWR